MPPGLNKPHSGVNNSLTLFLKDRLTLLRHGSSNLALAVHTFLSIFLTLSTSVFSACQNWSAGKLHIFSPRNHLFSTQPRSFSVTASFIVNIYLHKQEDLCHMAEFDSECVIDGICVIIAWVVWRPREDEMMSTVSSFSTLYFVTSLAKPTKRKWQKWIDVAVILVLIKSDWPLCQI